MSRNMQRMIFDVGEGHVEYPWTQNTWGPKVGKTTKGTNMFSCLVGEKEEDLIFMARNSSRCFEPQRLDSKCVNTNQRAVHRKDKQ